MLIDANVDSFERSVLPAQQARRQARSLPSNAVDASIDGQKIILVMQIGLVWMAGLLAAVLVAAYTELDDWASAFAVGWTVMSLTSVLAGVSHLLGEQLRGNEGTARAGWRYIRGHLGGLACGSLGFQLLTLFAGLAGAGLIMVLTDLNRVGPLIGGILLIPTFFFVLVVAMTLLNAYWLPFVMGAEACGLIEAAGILIRLVVHQPFQLVKAFREHSTRFISMGAVAFGSGLLTAGALAAAVALCARSTAAGLLAGGDLEAEGAIYSLSFGLIVYGWLAFLVVYATVELAMVYFNSLRIDSED